jgi:cell division protein FtsN
MARNDEGDFELVLGNRQLLSVFFILVVLLGIFFTMGYILGRSSEPASYASAPKRTAESRNPIVVDPAPSSEPTKPVETAPAQKPSAMTELVAQSTKQVTEPAKPAPAHTAPPKTAEPPKTATPPPPQPKPPVATAPARTAGTPAAGQTFLQVAAIAKSEADLYADVLAKKGFPSMVAPGPSATIFRVLVGPLPDSAAVAKTKVDLEAVGIKSIIRKF